MITITNPNIWDTCHDITIYGYETLDNGGILLKFNIVDGTREYIVMLTYYTEQALLQECLTHDDNAKYAIITQYADSQTAEFNYKQAIKDKAVFSKMWLYDRATKGKDKTYKCLAYNDKDLKDDMLNHLDENTKQAE